MTVDEVASHVRSMLKRLGYDIESVTIGSRAWGDHNEDTDVDIIIVSEGFVDTDYYARATKFQFE
jgi:predicted nucleotidyltransferase